MIHDMSLMKSMFCISSSAKICEHRSLSCWPFSTRMENDANAKRRHLPSIVLADVSSKPTTEDWECSVVLGSTDVSIQGPIMTQCVPQQCDKVVDARILPLELGFSTCTTTSKTITSSYTSNITTSECKGSLHISCQSTHCSFSVSTTGTIIYNH